MKGFGVCLALCVRVRLSFTVLRVRFNAWISFIFRVMIMLLVGVWCRFRVVFLMLRSGFHLGF